MRGRAKEDGEIERGGWMEGQGTRVQMLHNSLYHNHVPHPQYSNKTNTRDCYHDTSYAGLSACSKGT